MHEYCRRCFQSKMAKPDLFELGIWSVAKRDEGEDEGVADEGVAWFGKEVARNKMKFVAQFGREVAV